MTVHIDWNNVRFSLENIANHVLEMQSWNHLWSRKLKSIDGKKVKLSGETWIQDSVGFIELDVLNCIIIQGANGLFLSGFWLDQTKEREVLVLRLVGRFSVSIWFSPWGAQLVVHAYQWSLILILTHLGVASYQFFRDEINFRSSGSTFNDRVSGLTADLNQRN